MSQSAAITIISLTMVVASLVIHVLTLVIRLQKQHREELKKK